MVRAPVFIEDVPDYSIKGEHLHVAYRDFELVLPLRIFRLAMARCDRVLAEHDARQATVLPMRKKRSTKH